MRFSAPSCLPSMIGRVLSYLKEKRLIPNTQSLSLHQALGEVASDTDQIYVFPVFL